MRNLWIVFVSAVLMSVSIPALAHHSFSSEFDRTKPIDLKGVITKVEWANPHVGYSVDVKEPDGTVASWYFRGACPSGWIAKGIARDDLKIGIVIRIQGFQARDGSKKADGEIVVLPDGRTASVGYGAS
jgi:hypothetical protein